MNITFADTMNVGMNKIKEDEDYIWYQVEINIKGDEPEGYETDKRGRKWPIWKPRYAVFKFKKTGKLTDESFEFIKEETEPYFLQNINIKNRLKYICLSKMHQCMKNNNYPDKTGWQSG